MSADAMLAALLGSKHKVSMDLRANLKQVKKELKEEVGALFYQTTWSQTSNRLKKIKTFVFDCMIYDCAFCFFRRSKQETGGRTLKTRLAWTAGRRCLRQRLYRITGPVISLSTESIWKSAQCWKKYGLWCSSMFFIQTIWWMCCNRTHAYCNG